MGNISLQWEPTKVDDFFQDYLGIRNENVDMSEITRRINEDIYDKEEFDRAMKWVDLNCKEGKDHNPPEKIKSPERKHPLPLNRRYPWKLSRWTGRICLSW